MMTRLDLWVIRRALVGLPLNGEFEAVSAAVGSLVKLLEASPLAGRRSVLDRFLRDRADGDKIDLALADIDPSAPAPDAEADVEPASSVGLRTTCLADIRP